MSDAGSRTHQLLVQATASLARIMTVGTRRALYAMQGNTATRSTSGAAGVPKVAKANPNGEEHLILETIPARMAQRDWSRELAPFGERKLKVIIDISNKCNLRCRMCHFSFDEVFHRPAEHMRPEMFERLAASLLPNAHTLILSAGNEPLMSPWFVDILKIAAQYCVPELLFLTNAQLMNERIAQAILDFGVTQVHFSIDGATKESYEYIRRGASFERLLRNVGYLAAQKRTLKRSLPLLQFNVVLMRRIWKNLRSSLIWLKCWAWSGLRRATCW